jgi:hypothetical protein
VLVSRRGAGIHAEERLLHMTPRILSRILVARVRGDRFLPIDPCRRCLKLADKFGVTIKPIHPLTGQ